MINELLTDANALVENEGVFIKTTCIDGKNFISFSFYKKLKDSCCIEACKEWKKINNANPSIRFVHIWDSRFMTGYEQTARKRWLNELNEMSNQIEEIWLISDNIVIRGAASLMSKFSKHTLRSFRNIGELEAWYQKNIGKK